LGYNLVSVADAEAGKWILSQPHDQFKRSDFTISLARGIAKVALFILPTGETWKRHRKFMQPGFGPMHLKYAVEASNEVMDKLFGIWDEKMKDLSIVKGGKSVVEVDMYSLMTCVTTDVIGLVAFSVPYNLVLSHEALKKDSTLAAYQLAFDIISARNGVPTFLWDYYNLGVKQVTAQTKILRDAVLKTIQSKREAKESQSGPNNSSSTLPSASSSTDFRTVEGMSKLDVLDRLLEAQAEDKGFTDEEIVDEVLALFLAGSETSANALTLILYCLHEHPDVLSKLQTELDEVFGPYDSTKPNNATTITFDQLASLKYLEQVVKETLRLHPVIITSIPRHVINPEGVNILGYHIPPGTGVMVDIRGIQRSEQYWGPTALQFDPSRWDNGFTPAPGSYMPFADGPHMCLGYKMAMLEIKAVIAKLCWRYKVSVVEDQELRWVTSISHGFKAGIRMTVETR
jgi:cytochrome P450